MLLLLAVVPTLDAAKPASCRPDEAFANEEVRIWFQGQKGHIKVFDTNASDERASHYSYRTGALVERDAEGAELARMGLERAFPQTSECEIVETPEWVNMTLVVTERVRAGGAEIGDATVTFAYHFNKTSQGAKFDLFVASWPWQGDGELAYTFDVAISGGSVEAAENGVGFRDANGASQGYIEWAPNATARYDGGTRQEALVDAETVVAESNASAEVTLRFTNATAGYALLEYDPWVGAGEYVLVLGRLVGLAPVEQLVPRGVLGGVRKLL